VTEEYSVRIEPHGRTLRVSPGAPVLEAALAAGLNLPHSCKSGHCGSCRARLLAGELRYPGPRPLGVSAAEAAEGYVLLCQARPHSDVTVEARFIASVADVRSRPCPAASRRLVPLATDVSGVAAPAVGRAAAVPRRQYLDVLLGGRPPPQLLDRQSAARQRGRWNCTCGA
jgi:CDP-4-dehydro-6-deoxyglucose reductase